MKKNKRDLNEENVSIEDIINGNLKFKIGNISFFVGGVYVGSYHTRNDTDISPFKFLGNKIQFCERGFNIEFYPENIILCTKIQVISTVYMTIELNLREYYRNLYKGK